MASFAASTLDTPAAGNDPKSASSLTSLARLAVDTGGRFTERTNDLTLGFARAQRDLTCVYSIGFYDDPVVDRPRNVIIRVRRPGMRAIHPSRYLLRSPEDKRESLVRAAWVSPEMFRTGVMRAHLFPIRPATTKAWEGLLAVSFSVPLGAAGGASVQRDFGAVLSRPLGNGGASVKYKFDRRITLQPTGSDVSSVPLVTFVQNVELEPGSYELTAVLTEPGKPEPHATKLTLEVPEIPQKKLFLVDPLLGRRSGSNLIVRGGGAAPGLDEIGAENSFEPLLVQRLDAPDDLLVVTQACLVGAKKSRGVNRTPSVLRSLTRDDGTAVGTLGLERLALEGDGDILCQSLVDVLPAAALAGGDYVFTAELRSGRDDASAQDEVRFTVDTPRSGLSDLYGPD